MPSYSGLWNGVHGEDYSMLNNKPTAFKRVGRALKRRGMTVIREVIDTVTNGSSINGAAAVTYKRVESTVDPGNAVVNGGVRSIETVEKIAAASTTTTAQVADVDSMVDFKSGPAINSYPTDASGNGGGGKLS